MFVETPAGVFLTDRVAQDSAGWRYDFDATAGGQHKLWVMATDLAGDTSTVGPSEVTVVCTTADPSGISINAEPASLSRGAREQGSRGAEVQRSQRGIP